MGVAPPGKVTQGQASIVQLAKAQPRKEVVKQKPKEKEVPKATPPKDKEPLKEVVPKEKDLPREEIKRDFIEKFAPHFNLQAEFSKIKIVIPFTEIIRIPEYRGHLSHMLESQGTSDTLNL